MASIKFLLQSKSDNAQIYLRLSVKRGVDLKRKTDLFVNSKEWSIKTGLPKQNNPTNKQLNLTLKNLANFVIKNLNFDNTKGKTIDSKWLSFQIDSYFNRIVESKTNNLVIDFTKQFIETADTKVLTNGRIGLSKNRIRGLKTFLGLLKRFEEHIENKIYFTDIDYHFETQFRNWLLKEQNYKISYASKNMDNLKTICNAAIREGKDVNLQAKGLKAFSESKKDRIIQTLSFEELDKIFELELTKESLINAKKYILIGSYTGLRYSDLVRLKSHHIIINEGVNKIEIRQKKTDVEISIPILPIAMSIINEGLPYPVSAQKLNKQIKQVCKLAGIDEEVIGDKFIKLKNGKHRKIRGTYPKYELIASHTFRRSFATNFYKTVPTPIIMEITGHSKESTFLQYINKEKNKDDNARLFMEYVNKAKQKKRTTKIIPLQASNS